jgi:cell division transport system permease protein
MSSNKTKRIIRAGSISFFRSTFTSASSVLIMVITLVFITSLIFVKATLNTTLEDIKNQVDVTVYFIPKAEVSTVRAVEEIILKAPEVESVTYTSAAEALTLYKEKHANDNTILQVFDILETNPLGASLNIKAKDPSQYESILNYIKGDSVLSRQMLSSIDSVDYNRNKVVIDRLNNIISGAERLGFALAIVLIFISIAITFNTIRLVIFMSRDEIGVMKLVGAGKKYIRGPFIVSGILVGVLAAFITILLFLPISYWLGSNMTNFLGIDIFDYYKSSFFQLFFIQLITGASIGALSSAMAVHKYLNK